MRARISTILLLPLLLSTGCTRRPLDEADGGGARIPVKIDWSRSNIPVSEADLTGGEWVHRVSIRFYPLDGSPVFERYLEGNIFEGTIEVPPGSYRVIAMNESVEDIRYWENSISFSDVDNYDTFSATIERMPAADIAADFPFYRPVSNEKVIVEPLALASWSLDRFEVGGNTPTTDALTGIVMRGLTRHVNVTVRVKNLVSVQSMPAAARGFADKVYLSSARTAQTPATHLFRINRRFWDANQTDGTVQRTFLSFGRLPQETPGSYEIALDILLISGELFTDPAPMRFEVTEQVAAGPGPDIDIDLPTDPPGGWIELPFVEGGIAVDDWNDEEIDLN